MKRFLGFVRKEFFHIFRDYRTMLILFGLPVAQIMIFGYVVTNEIKDVEVAILDHSNDEVTKEIKEKILSSGYFLLRENLYSNDEIKDIFEKGNIKEVIIFQQNFAEDLEKEKQAVIQLIADASDPNFANMVVNYTSGIISDYVNRVNLLRETPMQIIPKTRMEYNENLKGAYMFVPGTMALILMLVSAMMTSITIAREKEFGSMEALLVSPLNALQIVLGKVTPYMVLSVINAVSIIALGNFVFGVPIHGSVVLLMLESILFILLALSLGILISTLSNNQQSAMFISMFALLLPTLLLSGFIFPIVNMPEVLQWLSLIVPPRWFITILKSIMLKGSGFEYIWKETLILIVMIVFYIGLSIRKFKMRLE